MNEFELIDTWFGDRNCHRQQSTNRGDVLLGIGDDAALIELPPDHDLVTASACLIPAQYGADAQSEFLARQCTEQALQALQKLQATPAWAVLCLCLEETDMDWLQQFSSSLKESLQHRQIQLIGGDTTRGPSQITLFLSGHRPRQGR